MTMLHKVQGTTDPLSTCSLIHFTSPEFEPSDSSVQGDICQPPAFLAKEAAPAAKRLITPFAGLNRGPQLTPGRAVRLSNIQP